MFDFTTVEPSLSCSYHTDLETQDWPSLGTINSRLFFVVQHKEVKVNKPFY